MHARQVPELVLIVVENGMLQGWVALTPHEPSLYVVDAPSLPRDVPGAFFGNGPLPRLHVTLLFRYITEPRSPVPRCHR